MKLFFTLSFVLSLILGSLKVSAQCAPKMILDDGTMATTGTFCEGQVISFKANSAGYTSTSIDWDFGYNGNTSSNENPNFTYPIAGTYTVTFKSEGASGTCNETLTVMVQPSPDIHISRDNDTVQCYENNSFCFTDTSKAPDGLIARQTYVFSNGLRIDSLNPVFPLRFCVNITDPSGGYFDLVIESLDTSGCLTREVFSDYIFVRPKLGVSFNNITPAPNPGCDSTLGVFKNSTLVSLSDVDTFLWMFGDGTTIGGNSSTNTEWWVGENNDGVIKHMYTTQGSFDGTLAVTVNGCSDIFVWKAAVANIVMSPKILSTPSPAYFSDNPIEFSVVGLPGSPGVDAFLWNFGDPSSGPANTENKTLTPSKTYDVGPWMISLRLRAGPCDITIYDTIQLKGPASVIEVAYDRVAFDEKYQCGTNDSIHFINNSKFYHNDANESDEDSVVTVNGQSQFVFNYTPPTGKGGVGIGNQTSLASAQHIANRTMGSNVWRIWDFGDPYAAQCTTSMARGQNVGVSCNWSEDEYPVHKYQSWDSVYFNEYYLANKGFEITVYNETTNTCSKEMVDTANLTFHRRLFDRSIPQEFLVELWHRDTVNGGESSSQVVIDHTSPDASKMTMTSGVSCPYDGNNLNYILSFKLNTGTQSYFAINFDSFANPTGFEPYNQGRILAPPAPGSSLPFLLPYSIAGAPGDEFVKGYSAGEVGNVQNRTPYGSFTMGVIVGNGPAVGGQPATCLDTSWYHDIFRILYLNADFSIIEPTTNKKYICAGEDAYYNIDNPIQENVETLVWRWGYQGLGRGPNLDTYVEQFEYYQEYTGPVSGRNDENIVYNGEDWLYNYVIRQQLSDFFGQVILDTIVTSIVKDWKVEASYGESREMLFSSNGNTGTYDTSHNELLEKDLYKMFGDGTFGCIDTTGYSESIIITKTAYRSYNGDPVFMVGDRRYRYTNAGHTDSVEVAHVLHFRDSSLRGYDTLIIGTDTTYGVWKKSYTYPVLVAKDPCNPFGDKDTVYRNANGPMMPTLSLSNTVGCNVRSSKILNVGFYNNLWMDNTTRCQGLNIIVEDSIRYYQYGVEDPFTYPIKDFEFWQNRYAASIEKYEVDWGLYTDKDSFDFERSMLLNHTYAESGKYDVTIVSTDSVGCTDTVRLEAFVSKLNPDFILPTIGRCGTTTSFTDSSWVVDPCNENGCGNSEDICEQIVRWEWDFGDGTRKSILQNPNHNFTSHGYFDVKLLVWTKLGCVDSITKRIYKPGPQPEFEFDLSEWKDTAWVCLGDSVFLQNLSKTDASSPDFVMHWGDGAITQPDRIGVKYGYVYRTAGVYNLYLEQQERMGNGLCRKYFPDTNPDLMVQRRMVVVVYPKPEVHITASTSPTYVNHPTEYTAHLDSKYTRMKWLMGDDNNTVIARNVPNNSIVFKYLSEGFYNLILVPEYDELPRCWARDTLQIEVRHDSLNSVPELDFDLEVYPNPSHSTIYVNISNDVSIENITVLDIQGKLHAVSFEKNDEGLVKVDVRALVAGTYVLKIETSKGIVSKKVSVLKE